MLIDKDGNELVAIFPEVAGQEALSRMKKAERDAIDKSDFAWPDAPGGPKYPIDTQEHLDAAAKLIGQAPDDKQAEIKANAISIAKKNHLQLPDSWQSDDNKDGSQERALSIPQAVIPETVNIYLPITRSDENSRMVFGQATTEKPDSYGTIFGYYPEAWKTWRGNIREQHDSKKAVGKSVDLQFDDLERSVYVGSKVSRGAQDTWFKVEDGVLSGYSAAVLPDPEYGSDPRRWPKKEYAGKMYPYLPKYRVLELSLVDSPATPNCDIQIVRADGFVTDIVDTEEVEQQQESPAAAPEPQQTPSGDGASSLSPSSSVVSSPSTPAVLERAGARLSADTQNGLHTARDGAVTSAISLMQLCGCPQCTAAANALDPDGDGDIDWMGLDDPDADASDMDGSDDGMDSDAVERLLAPVYSRQQQFLAQLAKNNTHYDQILAQQAQIMERLAQFDSVLERLDSLDEVRASLGAVKDQVTKIADTPMPGGPVMGGAPRPVDKFLPNDPRSSLQRSAPSPVDELEVLENLRANGAFSSSEDQVAAAARVLQLMQRR